MDMAVAIMVWYRRVRRYLKGEVGLAVVVRLLGHILPHALAAVVPASTCVSCRVW